VLGMPFAATPRKEAPTRIPNAFGSEEHLAGTVLGPLTARRLPVSRIHGERTFTADWNSRVCPHMSTAARRDVNRNWNLRKIILSYSANWRGI